MLSQDFGCWSCGSNFFGLLVPLTPRDSTPFIQWYWAIYATNNTWVADYPPTKIDEYVAAKKRAILERDDRIKQIRQGLEPKVAGIRTRLTAVSERFRIGSPVLFRLELINRGSAPVHYMDSGVAFAPLKLFDDKQHALSSVEVPMQIGVRRGEAAPGASVVLADKIDLNLHYAITKPGKYFVQFTGADLEIGEPVPAQDWGPFGENEILSVFDFVAATNRFPSNLVKIEVAPGKRQ